MAFAPSASIPTVEISGSPGERGETHGRAAADGIARFYDNWTRVARDAGIPVRDAEGFALGLLPESRRQAPDLVTEVEGIAAGAGLPFERVWLLNCFDELGGYALYAGINAGRACTTFAASGHSTTRGETLIGQSWDINAWYDPLLLRIAPGEDEPGAVIFTHPGVVGGTGINDRGIALVWNSLQARDARQGVPVPLLVRRGLQATKLSDAVTATLTPTRAIGFNFIIGSDFGAVNIEAAAARQHITYLGRHFAHANHYEAPELLALEGNPTYPGSSFVRGGRMRQLLDNAAGQIDLELCQDLLRDHANYPGSICAHDDEREYPYLTRAAVVYVPAKRAMYITDGPPCQAPFVEYQVEATTAVSV